MFAWKPLFAGHRGGYTGVMNTAEAYRNGVSKYGYSGLECDVRVTLDGQYVISHDETTNAVGGNLTVANATLAQLQAENYSQTRGGVTYTGHICTVDEYLQICQDSAVFPIIELKYTTGINSNDMSKFPGLYALIQQHGLVDKAIILTSMLNSLIYVRQNYPALKCQYLMNSLSDERFAACLQYGLEPSISVGGFTACDVKKCHDAGLKVAAWTVNTQANYQLYGDMGVYMMTCDYLYPSEMPELSATDWDNICEEVLDPLTLYVTPVYDYTMASSTLPAAFPSAANQAQQACYVDGITYANDYANQVMYAYDTLGNRVNTSLPATVRHGICRDDAGHIILHSSPSAGTPSQLLIYRTPSSVADTINFSLVHNGQTNFPSASGDIYSAEGGYVYFFPNGQKYVDALKFQNGELVDIISSSELSIAGSTAGWVIPIDNDPTHFIYQVRSNGYYMYNLGDKGAYVASTATTTAPGRNSSIGGAYFKLGTHTLFLHASGGNYNGGWTIKDISANKASIYSQPELGTAGYSGNPSCGAFFYVEQVDTVTVIVREWCLGNGYAAWRVSSHAPLVMTPVSGVELDQHSLELPRGGKAHLMASVLPEDAYNKAVSWQCANTAIATVSQDGLVSGIAEGTTWVYVTTEDGNFKDSCMVQVAADLSFSFYTQLQDFAIAELADKTIRRMVANDGKVFVLAVDNAYSPYLYMIDTKNANSVENISTAACSYVGLGSASVSVASPMMPLSDIAMTEDGVLLGCNQEYATFDPVNPFVVYRWEDNAGTLTPQVLFSKASTQTSGNYTKANIGHSMAYTGTLADGKLVTMVYTLGSATRSLRFTAFAVQNGELKSTAYQRPATSPTMADLGNNVALYPYVGNHWLMAAPTMVPRLYTIAADAQNPAYSDMAATFSGKVGLSRFTMQGVPLLVVPSATDVTICNAGEDFATASVLSVSGNNLPALSNTTFLASYAEVIEDGNVIIYILRDNHLTVLSTAATDPTSMDAIEQTYSVMTTPTGIMVRGEGLLEVTVYSVAGIPVASVFAEDEAAVSLDRGAYVVRVNEMVKKVLCR